MQRHPAHYGEDWSTVQEADEEAVYFQEKYGHASEERRQEECPADDDSLPF